VSVTQRQGGNDSRTHSAHSRALPRRTVRSPLTGEVIGDVPDFRVEDIDPVFTRAVAAGAAWRDLTVEHRARLLVRTADLLETHAEALSGLIAREVAKTTRDARDEVLRSADYLRLTADEAKRMTGSALAEDGIPQQGRKLAIAFRVPLGCVLAIPPFNYPVNLAVSKIAPALAVGNTVVLKPASQGSLSGMALTRYFHDAGVPEDVLQIVTGAGSTIGHALVTHPSVDMINFTGSTETGRSLAGSAGMVPLLLELGGKDAAIVLPDADIRQAADAIVAGAFAYSGQRCTGVKRIIVVEKVADELVREVATRVRHLSAGLPSDISRITPLVDPAGTGNARSLVTDAVRRGATLIEGGRSFGNLMWPTLVDRVTAEMQLAWVEPFAPVLPVMRVPDAATAIDLCNASEYGLQAAVFSRDINEAMRIAFRLDVGTVQVNGRTARGPDHFPFVGVKSSGMGVQGVRYSLEAVTRLKSIVFNTVA
jgi:glyceraldehyde-3-phosphate dehydrogenase (NADP+)